MSLKNLPCMYMVFTSMRSFMIREKFVFLFASSKSLPNHFDSVKQAKNWLNVRPIPLLLNKGH